MEQTYPSLPLSIKEIRFLLRRINRCIREIDRTTVQIPSVESPQAFDLIYAKAQQIINDRKSEGIMLRDAESERIYDDYFINEEGEEDDDLNIFKDLIQSN